MHPSQQLTRIGSALACTVVATGSLHAGGIALYEIATRDVGLASAGYAARAEDASTVFKNPAGMSRLPEAQFEGGLQLLYGNVAFTKDPAQTGPRLRQDADGGNALGALPAASAFFVQPLTEKLAVGAGAFSYFGLMERFDDHWVGRYYIQEGTTLGLSLMPSVSFKATDWLSIGAGLNAMFGYFSTETGVRTGPFSPDGKLKLDDTTWGFGANAGLLLTPRAGTRIGLTYLSPVDLDFETRPEFSGLGPLGNLPVFSTPPELDLGLTVPQMVMLSLYQELSAKWALMADVGWQNWDQFGKLEVGVDSDNPQSLTAELNYQDTWHGAIGAQYRLSDRWTLTGGFAYDTSAVADEHRTLSLPMGEAYRFGLGAQWQVSRAISLGAAYEFLWGGDMPVVQDSAYRGRVAGSFNDTWFSFFAFDLAWRF